MKQVRSKWQHPGLIPLLVFLAAFTFLPGCGSGEGGNEPAEQGEKQKVIRNRRDDGTLSSVAPVDKDGYVHGVKVNFYEDGKTVHSRVTYEHGRKHGPAIWYYKNGQIYEHTSFRNGRREGLTKRYYESGELMEEFRYEQGKVVPGSKESYERQGE